MFKELLSQFGAEAIKLVLAIIIGYVSIVVKNLYKKYVNTEIKKSVVKTCVRGIEQIYTDLHGEEKFNMCVSKISQILSDKGIPVSDVELSMLIESAVKKMNTQIKIANK